jgi:hypothetical protein
MKVQPTVVENDVKLKVENALTYLTNQAPGQRISVSEVCRLAGVSRANLYSSHSDLLAKIRDSNKSSVRRLGTKNASNRQLSEELKVLRKKVKALAFLCLELKSRNERLESRLVSLQRQRTKVRSSRSKPPAVEGLEPYK